MDEFVKIQENYISILLKNKPLVEVWINSPLKVEYFDQQYHYILNAVIEYKSKFNNET